MELDEAMAYAQASWSRFEAEISDRLLRAVCAAFVVVAAADGYLDKRETERFLKLLRDNLGALPRLDFARVEAHFRELTEAVMSDPDAGRRHALADIAALRGTKEQSDLVYSAARLAAIADGRVALGETNMLDEIVQALANR